MTTTTTAPRVDKGIEIGLLQGSAQPALPTPKPRLGRPDLRIPAPELGPVPVAPAKPCVLVMHYDLGTLD